MASQEVFIQRYRLVIDTSHDLSQLQDEFVDQSQTWHNLIHVLTRSQMEMQIQGKDSLQHRLFGPYILVHNIKKVQWCFEKDLNSRELS